MEEILSKFIDISRDAYASLAKRKALDQRKMIGCLPMHFPEEVVLAAGALPVVMLESHETITMADRRIQSFFCELGRSFIDMGLKGKLGFLDGIISPDTCHTVRGGMKIASRNFPAPYHESFFFPCALGYPRSRAFLLKELHRLKTSLEEFLGREITKQSLVESINTYNRHRALTRGLYELRRNRPGLIKAREVLAIVVSSMLMPKEEHSELLSGLLPQLRDRKATGEGIKLVLSGSLCLCPDPGLLDVIEESGAVVVDDDLYTGSRYFATDVKNTPDPVEALADAYLNMIPCPTRHNAPQNDWADYLIKMVRASRAQAVITLLPKYCEPHSFYVPYLEKRFQAAGIPHLVLETVPEITGSMGQIRTRVQAFFEVVGGM